MEVEGNSYRPPSRFKLFFQNHRKPILIIAPIVLLVIVAAVIWFTSQGLVGSSGTNGKITTNTAAPVLVAAPLTGVLIDANVAKQPITAVMIENSYPDARPQSGLTQAGVVYEALAEGGITRFMAIFQEPLPSIIGPVRSLRPYFLDWGLEYNIPVAHAGGSQPALAKIAPLGLKNIEALVQSSGFYRATDRPAPHNLYTKTDLLTNLLTKLGYNTAPTFTPLPRKADAPPAATVAPTHPDIKIVFGAAAYNTEYKYDAASNSYSRFNGGTAQIDRTPNKQIMVKNVVVEMVPTTYSTQPDGKPETDYNIIGSGKAFIFEDGGVTLATWNKASDKAVTKLLDAAGQPITFNRGTTWYSIVPVGNAAVTY